MHCRAAIVIPARYASTRYPGKPLAPVRGASGAARPLIARSIDAARQVAGVDSLYVATDDSRIAEAVRALDVDVIMTSPACANGTERLAEAASELADDIDVLVNFQGDALLTPPDLVEALLDHMRADPACEVATVAVRCSASAYRHLISDQTAGRSGGTTVVLGVDSRALYFSKRVLPHILPGSEEEGDPPVWLHLGLYAYRRAALRRYAVLGPCELEVLEGLEQLRFLTHGIPVHVVRAPSPAWDVIELNNPTDLQPIEAVLMERGIA
ncbi:3-deoxy-manno-octulosonate cytidylyltransferase [Sphingomonas fennica]|uniref:3-deoxy-manno-octulosonate cytidylyltransferase n=1 Tax=Edaphosphingomonas fennica TaxID=114404 RepID=A0A2T4HLU1_9SPHN|nr:3-deoxy-manno-octulosonate cytidylyltransferase [Sphingomonas fennica]